MDRTIRVSLDGGQSYGRINNALFGAVVFALLFVLSCSSPKPAPGWVEVTNTSPVHWKTAALDKGGNVVEEGSLVTYDQAFSTLEGKCSNSRTNLADLAQVAVEGLQEKGSSMSRLEFLRHLNQSIPVEMGVSDCKEAAAALWTLLESR